MITTVATAETQQITRVEPLLLEVADVANVNQVETAVGQDQFLTRLAQSSTNLPHFFEVDEFRRHVAIHPPSILTRAFYNN
jgi:hypothetical protein